MKSIHSVLRKAWQECYELGISLDEAEFFVSYSRLDGRETPDAQLIGIDVKGTTVVQAVPTAEFTDNEIVGNPKFYKPIGGEPSVVLKTKMDYIKEIEELKSHVAGLKAALAYYEQSLETSKRQIAERDELLASARCIAHRGGRDTAWCRFDRAIRDLGISSITARIYKLLDGELDV